MPVELEKIDRYSFPSGVLDVTLRSDGELLYAACMDGIYELPLTHLVTDDPARNEIAPNDSVKEEKPKESQAKTDWPTWQLCIKRRFD